MDVVSGLISPIILSISRSVVLGPGHLRVVTPYFADKLTDYLLMEPPSSGRLVNKRKRNRKGGGGGKRGRKNVQTFSVRDLQDENIEVRGVGGIFWGFFWGCSFFFRQFLCIPLPHPPKKKNLAPHPYSTSTTAPTPCGTASAWWGAPPPARPCRPRSGSGSRRSTTRCPGRRTTPGWTSGPAGSSGSPGTSSVGGSKNFTHLVSLSFFFFSIIVGGTYPTNDRHREFSREVS